jgi:hypothetical protein
MDGFSTVLLEAKFSVEIGPAAESASSSGSLKDDAASVSPTPTETMDIVNAFLLAANMKGERRQNLEHSITNFLSGDKE